jgi:hypothetical protein
MPGLRVQQPDLPVDRHAQEVTPLLYGAAGPPEVRPPRSFLCRCEEGSYPLISTSDPGETADSLRGMVLPPEYALYPDTAIWIEGERTCHSEWKSHAQTVVTLI